MTTQNPTEKDPKPGAAPPADAAPKDEKHDGPPQIKRELTDDEIASVNGGARQNTGFSPF